MAAVMHSAAELWVPCLRVTISSLQAVYPLDARPLGHDATLYCAPPDAMTEGSACLSRSFALNKAAASCTFRRLACTSSLGALGTSASPRASLETLASKKQYRAWQWRWQPRLRMNLHWLGCPSLRSRLLYAVVKPGLQLTLWNLVDFRATGCTHYLTQREAFGLHDISMHRSNTACTQHP